jgi:hypothetical protein
VKRALLIGINRYPNLPEGNQLHGCVNDVEAVAVLLRDRFGFADDDVTLLRNDEATQAGIRTAVETLIAATGDDDVVLIHYSGHGSQRSSTDPTEGDGLDETIVPHDSGRRPHPNLEITDKEINGWVRRLNEKTANLTFVFDCCHSGTITRDAFGEAGRSVEPDRRAPEEMGLVPPPAADADGDGDAGERGPSGWLPLTGRYVLIAGSLDAELSHEMEAGAEGTAVPHGALSFFLARELAVARPGTTYRDVFERASVAVSSRYRDQHPQMEGDARDREVLGTKVVEVMPFVSVSERSDGSVTLQGGAAFGLAPGSQWDVYPEGSKEATPGLRLGRVRVEELRALSSRASLLEEARPGAIVPGCRAVEAVHAFGDQRLGVEVRGPTEAAGVTKELEVDVDASPYLRVAPTEAADLRVYLLPPRTGAAEGDPVPQLGRIDRASWAAVGRDGRLAMPVHPVDEPGAAETVRSNLERIARYRSAVALTNPDPGAILRGKVDFVLQARGPDGAWADATPTAAGGTVVFAEGDRIALRITNGHTDPVYVSVLDFGLTGRIAQVYPPGGVADRVDPGMEIRVGVDPRAELPLEFPPGFPFVRDPDEATPAEGLETLKLFATTGRPVNFDPLLQEGVRADVEMPEEGSPLGRLLTATLRGQGTRDIAAQPLAAPPDEQWITVDRPFVLRRR